MAVTNQNGALAAAKQAAALRRAANQAEAARKAEEERRQRRREIEKKIREWEEKLRIVEAQIAALTDENAKLGQCLSDWNTQKSKCSASEILSEVVVLNVFEGVCADQIKTDLEACLTKMDGTCSNVTGLSGSISNQIARLQEYASLIQTKLSALRSELNSI